MPIRQYTYWNEINAPKQKCDRATTAVITICHTCENTLTLSTYPGADVYDTENSYYTEETRENYNSNPFDKIDWTYNGEMTSGEVALVQHII